MHKRGENVIKFPELIFVIILYLGCLLVFFTGVSPTAIVIFFVFSYIKGFGTTAGFHRYFSHKSFKTSRFFQFILALLGSAALQGSVLSWTAVHRYHHKHSDTKEDFISPVTRNLFWTQFACWSFVSHPLDGKKNNHFDSYPEILWLDRYWLLIALSQIPILFGIGYYLEIYYPNLNTNGLQLIVWGFFIGTVYNYNLIGLVNGWCHLWGSKPYATKDNSRNNFIIAILTMGEGWHNNHHKFPYSERQGIEWWQIDISHYILKFLSWFGIVWELKVPKGI